MRPSWSPMAVVRLEVREREGSGQRGEGRDKAVATFYSRGGERVS